MKMIAEYLAHALAFERIAADELEPEIKGKVSPTASLAA
jgi:hypothetical protein